LKGPGVASSIIFILASVTCSFQTKRDSFWVFVRINPGLSIENWSPLLILEIIVTVAGGLALIYLLADRALSAQRYHGPTTKHFDGRRFHNLEPPAHKGFIDFLRWQLTSKPGPWNKWTDSQPGSAPPSRVTGVFCE